MPDITSVYSAMRYGDFNMPLGQLQGAPIRGTSIASPAVLATAVQAHQYESFFSSLYFVPVKKAVLLAGSVDSNSDGAIGLSTTWSGTADAKDGAGHVNLSKVKQILDDNSYVHRDLVNSDLVSCGSGCREWSAGSATTNLNQSVRAALVVEACTTGDTQGPTLVNDLDLALVRTCTQKGGGGAVSTTLSDTVTSETEMAQVASCATGSTWSVRVRIKNGATLQPCGSSNFQRIGVAWSK